jgi:putative ABC transport system permease protein
MLLRLIIRQLRRSPGTTLPVIVTLGLATGFLAAAAAVVNGVLVRPLPYADTGSLVALHHAVHRGDLVAWQSGLSSFDGLCGAASADHVVRGLDRVRILRVAFVSSGFFATVRPRILAGRLPASDERAFVLVSERLIRNAGAAPATALGRTLSVLDGSFPVIGILPADVGLPEDGTDIWLPADAADAVSLVGGDDRTFGLFGRLRPGVTVARAAEEATRLRRALFVGDEAERRALSVTAVPVEQATRGSSRLALLAFLAGGVLILLVAAANVASLLLSRTLARERELAITAAIGASPLQIGLILFSEALLLSACGSALGLGLAAGALAVLKALAAGTVPRLDEARIDPATVAVAVAASILAASLCTIASWWYASRHESMTLRASGSRSSRRTPWLEHALTSVQVALSVTVVVSAVLLGRTLANILETPTGVRTDGALTARMMLGDRTILSANESRAVADRLLRDIEQLPGVRHAGLSGSLPPATSIADMSLRIVEGNRDESQSMALVSATPRWDRAVGLTLVEGRFLALEDADADRPGVVLSRSTARHLFGGKPAVGSLMPTEIPGTHGRKARVVGIVADVRYAGLLSPAGGAIYVPWEALPFAVVHLVVRGDADPRQLAGSVAEAARRRAPQWPLEDVRTLDEAVTASVADRRMYALVGGALAITTFAVAVVGLVAMLTRAVRVRRHEFAVRLAVGATPTALALVIVRLGATAASAGLVAGIPLALGTATVMASALHGVSPTGPATYAMVAGVTLVAAVVSCAWPAWQAYSIPSVDALRKDDA